MAKKKSKKKIKKKKSRTPRAKAGQLDMVPRDQYDKMAGNFYDSCMKLVEIIKLSQSVNNFIKPHDEWLMEFHHKRQKQK